ncbi:MULTISPECIES: 2TM domain-containing protein [Chryseobacterium]|uniref:Two-component system LytT family sensor kinase n=1 Tax=Chryseobacterium camelliae TaxID=1265445 RepID=A0ABU0TPC0_9FLAO|nr:MULTISPECIES: 2TM domain-containing protein [Chryseobacterium]MDT3407961.1 two-component system LytT family sensor kinase [Pseudacidovorax intermedius]MDQ1098180.1 two-component system LytT family sensor kinase [Chryseobacterium camelliae]MDQ1102110.1 two-component system LytT family sensor kinase [Chryseobacterium sp. SORGH_AS_1048]MDR6085548.1 two-component system LytT family sensor kinase [Chryseobacterium sp. SORGH_AS_0909]MDR6129910.1 two-component system LytT family sensor kinase [Chr
MKRRNLITLCWISLATSMIFFFGFTDEKTLNNFLLTVVVCFMYSFVLAMGNSYINDFLNKRFPWSEATTRRAIISIVSILIANTIMVYFCNYMNFVVFQKAATTEEYFSGKFSFINWFTINIALLISAFLHAKGFMEELKKTSRKEVVEQKLIAKSANAQFESLKNQLDPHFLFNSLNVLSSLIDENPNQAQKFTVSMSKIYRYVLEQKDKELVTVEDEIEFARTYCELLKTRFEDSVDFIFDVRKEDYRRFVVPLSLQLLLENCIKHNFATSSRPLIIKIFSENDTLCIENNLQVREQIKESSGIGLANIVQRYSLLTKRNVFIEKSEDYFKVKLPVLVSKPNEISIKTDTSDKAYERAQKRVKELKSFYSNLTSYCIVIPSLVIINLITSPNHLWFYYPMLGWGIGVAAHGVSAFGLGKRWEDKKIREILEKQNK